jgi:calcium permeable stress-gated cation channel
MQSLIKKDREEQSKPEMTEFFNNLATAYYDPVLKPIQLSSSSDEHTAPLLYSG